MSDETETGNVGLRNVSPPNTVKMQSQFEADFQAVTSAVADILYVLSESASIDRNKALETVDALRAIAKRYEAVSHE